MESLVERLPVAALERNLVKQIKRRTRIAAAEVRQERLLVEASSPVASLRTTAHNWRKHLD